MLFQPVINPILLSIILIPALTLSMWLSISAWKASPIVRKAWLRRSLAVIIIGIMCFRPGISEIKNVDIYTNQYDVYFVVDTTASMIAEDWDEEDATRLSGVQKDIGLLVDDYSGAKFALITFDSSAVIRTPLTKDATALMTSVKNMSPEITKNSKGSSPWRAAKLLESTLKKNAQLSPDRAKIVFMFTDGESTSEEETIDTYATTASSIQGGTVYGYGTSKGGKMKKQNGYFISSKKDIYIQDETTTPPTNALSKIDPKNLKNISKQLGVKYSLRDSNKPIEAPKVDSTSLSLTQNSSMQVTNDYTWVAALLLCILLSFELGNILLTLSRLKKVYGEPNG